MRLANLLKLPGGVAEQGRRVILRLRYQAPGGAPSVRDLEAVMLPVSEVEAHQVQLAADAAARAKDAPLPAGGEFVVRFLQASLRDPGDLSKRLVEDETDLRALRTGLAAPAFQGLLDEYKRLIEEEYPAVVTAGDAADLEAEARDFSPGGQPSPG